MACASRADLRRTYGQREQHPLFPPSSWFARGTCRLEHRTRLMRRASLWFLLPRPSMLSSAPRAGHRQKQKKKKKKKRVLKEKCPPVWSEAKRTERAEPQLERTKRCNSLRSVARQSRITNGPPFIILIDTVNTQTVPFKLQFRVLYSDEAPCIHQPSQMPPASLFDQANFRGHSVHVV